MRVLLSFAALLLVSSNLIAGPRSLVVNPGCSGGIPVYSSPNASCPITAYVFHQTQLPLCQCCEKIDACGNVWAKVEIKGWVTVRCGGSRALRRLMTRDREWQVTHCPVVMESGNCPTDMPVAKLQPCAVVNKLCQGLPTCKRIYACHTGWVLKERAGMKFLY